MNVNEMMERATSMVASVATDEPRKAAEILKGLSKEATPPEVMMVCVMLGIIGADALKRLVPNPPGGMYAFGIEELPNGGPRPPAEKFALRFVVCLANEDHQMAFALYRTTAEKSSDEEYLDSVIALLNTAATLVRSAVDGMVQGGK